MPLAKVALEALGRHRARQAADKLRAGGAYKDQDYVFADESGAAISPMAAASAYAPLARKAGISSTRLHECRHTAATALLSSGVDARTVSGILGHSSPCHHERVSASSGRESADGN
jgi:integrase